MRERRERFGGLMRLRLGLRGAAAMSTLVAMLAGAQSAQAQDAGAPVPAPVAAPPAHFFVRAIQVVGNKLLTPADVERIVYPFMGPDRTADDIEHARAALQKAFEDKGYPTVSVYIPEQTVDSGIIKLQVQPQTVGQVQVAGGKRTSKDWVLSRAPSIAPGSTPNFHDFQRDIVALNQSGDRKVTPDVKAGAAPGTVDVTLNVEDHSPLHGSLELNNYNSPSTTDLRVAGTLRYDDMWGRGDSLSVSGQVAPRRIDDGWVVSANYLAHIGKLQALGYFVHSDSDIGVVGGTTVVGKGDMAGVRLIMPLSQREGFYQSLTAGIDYKNFQENVLLGADRSTAPIEYFPVTVGWRADWTGNKIKSFLSANLVFGVRGLGDDLVSFSNKRYGASPDFFYFKGEGAATVDTWKGFQVYGHFTGQYSDSPLVSNEEFSLGGADTVRGYDESENLGDYGFAYQFEVRTPKLFPDLSHLGDLRFLAFVDSGYWGIHRPLIGQDASGWLASAGGGVRLKLFNFWNGSVDVGVPLRTGPDTRSGDVFGRFRIWGEF